MPDACDGRVFKIHIGKIGGNLSKEKIMIGKFKNCTKERGEYLAKITQQILDREMREQELMIAQFIKQNPDYPIEDVVIVRQTTCDGCKMYLEPKEKLELTD